MKTSRLTSLAIIATLTAIPFESVALSHDMAVAQQNSKAADLIVRGQIVQASSQPLPHNPNIVVLGSAWVWKVRIDSVLQGDERSKLIIVKGDSDGIIRQDKSFTFYLARNLDGTYQLEKLRRVD